VEFSIGTKSQHRDQKNLVSCNSLREDISLNRRTARI
jgi:hypothetical protein